MSCRKTHAVFHVRHDLTRTYIALSKYDPADYQSTMPQDGHNRGALIGESAFSVFPVSAIRMLAACLARSASCAEFSLS
jgi:hypothetical protein